MTTHQEILDKFKDGKTRGTGSRIFIYGDVLYSFGRHFPLLVRIPHWNNGFLMNADKYSSTTSKHQSLCFNTATIQIPFSALEQAIPEIRNNWDYDFSKLNLVDKEEANWIKTGFFKDYSNSKETKTISKKEFNNLNKQDQMKYNELEERRPEAAVLEYEGKYYLSSMDENNYFISLLPDKVDTVKKAFRMLMPEEVKGQGYIRQGEWFFVQLSISEKEAKKVYNIMDRDIALPKKDDTSNSHIATRFGYIMDIAFDKKPSLSVNPKTPIVSGQIRHPEHRMTKLSTLRDIKIFAAFENRAVNSWSAEGNVD